MSTETGASKQAHQFFVQEVFGNGVELKLMGEKVSYSDGAGVIDDKQVGTNLSTDASDWNISYDSTTREVTVTNAVEMNYGETNVGTVNQLVADPEDGSEHYVVIDESNNPQLTGEKYSFPPGDIEYVLGAQ
jgi:hypothetical protein